MKVKQSLSWLLSLLMLGAAAVFTACSDDDDKGDPNVIKAGENDPLGTPIGLVYTDFITENDVVHNADTTELTISKALADKKGITNFVNRPMVSGTIRSTVPTCAAPPSSDSRATTTC